MRKIIVIGNPPYQELDGGFGASAKPIYNVFIEKLLEFKVDELLFLIPAKWFVSGKGLTQFRQKIKNCGQIKTIKFIKKSQSIFKCIQMHGGLCILYYQKNYQGHCEFITDTGSKTIDLKKYDVILSDIKADSILEKTQNKYKSIGEIMYQRNCFGIRTDYFIKNKSLEKDDVNAIFCLSQQRKINYINKQNIKRNLDLIDLYKVIVSGNHGFSSRQISFPKHQIFILKPGQISTETYNVMKCFENEKDALLFQKYLQTDFARYLLKLRKVTQSTGRFYWLFVPAIDTQIEWTDALLAQHFNLSDEEQLHIKNSV